MDETSELELFLSKLTALCREYNVEIFAMRSQDKNDAVRSLSEEKQNWIYKLVRSPWTPEGTWELLCLTNEKIERDSEEALETCIADERYIKLIEAGLA